MLTIVGWLALSFNYIYEKKFQVRITSLRSITMFCELDNTPHNIPIHPTLSLNQVNIPWNIIGYTKHSYGSEQCYAWEWTGAILKLKNPNQIYDTDTQSIINNNKHGKGKFPPPPKNKATYTNTVQDVNRNHEWLVLRRKTAMNTSYGRNEINISPLMKDIKLQVTTNPHLVRPMWTRFVRSWALKLWASTYIAEPYVGCPYPRPPMGGALAIFLETTCD